MRFSLLAGILPMLVLGHALSAQGIFDVPSAYPTIQAAINAATPGSVVAVAPGNYAERIDFLGKDIVVRSTDGPSVTTIVGTGLATPIVQCGSTPATARFEGFTILGAQYVPVLPFAAAGTAIDTGMSANVVAAAGVLSIEDCIFTGNDTLSYGTVQLRGLPLGVRSRLSRCLLIANGTNVGVVGFGAAVFTTDASRWIIEDCQFIGNGHAAIRGGHSTQAGIELDVRRCDFIDNGPYGALSVNSILFPSAPGPTVAVEECRFVGNTGDANSAGAVQLTGGRQVAVLRKCVFRGNSSLGAGGAVRSFAIPLFEARECVFDSNSSATYGGAVFYQSSSVPAISAIAQSTFFGNTATFGGGAIEAVQFLGAPPQLIIGNCLVRGNSSQQVSEISSAVPSIFMLNCDIEGGWTGQGGANFDADPLWHDAAGGDFRTFPGSPVIDAGHPAGELDDDGTLPDVGAYLNQTFGPSGESTVPVNGTVGFASLSVAGSIGGAFQTRRLPIGSAVDFRIRPTPGLALTTEWLLYGYFGFPTAGQTLPLGFGTIVMPSPFSGTDPNALLIGSSVPGLGLIGGVPAPWTSANYVVGFPLELVVQAIVRTGNIDYRTSNAVRLVVQ